MRISNDGLEVFSSYASCKSCSEITASMPWPLNCDMGAELSDLLTTSAYIPRAACVSEAQEMRAPCMFDWQGTQTFFSRSGMLNPKFGLSCVHCINSNIVITSLVCTLRNSKCAIQMIIQITHFALVWKQSKFPLMWYPNYTLQKCDITSCSHMVRISKKYHCRAHKFGSCTFALWRWHKSCAMAMENAGYMY